MREGGRPRTTCPRERRRSPARKMGPSPEVAHEAVLGVRATIAPSLRASGKTLAYIRQDAKVAVAQCRPLNLNQ